MKDKELRAILDKQQIISRFVDTNGFGLPREYMGRGNIHIPTLQKKIDMLYEHLGLKYLQYTDNCCYVAPILKKKCKTARK